MFKSNHRYEFGIGIPVDELSNFINPINMSLFVNKEGIYSTFRSTNDSNRFLDEFYNNIFSLIPSYPQDQIKGFIYNHAGITYTPHTTGYDFRISPIDFINELFKSMNINYEIPFINLDNGFGMNYLKDYVRAYIADFKRDEDEKNKANYDKKLSILEDLNTNLDDIVKIYYKDVDNLVYHNVIPKDMLLYLAFKSIDEYERTKDEKYLVLPYEYYTYVSHMKTSPYPHRINFRNANVWFDSFRQLYTNTCDPNMRVEDNPYTLNDHELLLAWDILKPGMLERELRDTFQKGKSKPNVDYDKYLALFEMKMNFYMNSPYINYIQGKYGLNGYIGFSYKNEYLLFDKFHNSETIDPSKKTILTHGEAIYALPSDRFNVIKGDKQQVIDARKYDDRIKKVNHTPNFTNRLESIITGPNVSYASFDKILEQEKKRILIKK